MEVLIKDQRWTEWWLTERRWIVVVFGKVLLLGQYVIDASVLIQQVHLWVLHHWGWRRLLHPAVHYDCHRVVYVAELLDRVDVARQLLRCPSYCSRGALLDHTSVGLLDLWLFNEIPAWLRPGHLHRFLRDSYFLAGFRGMLYIT